MTPKELPDRYFMVPSPDPKKNDQEKVDGEKSKNEEDSSSAAKKIIQNGFKCRSSKTTTTEADNMSDNLSGVSMGTSSWSSDTVSKKLSKII